MPRCALGGQRVGSAPPTATNRHPRAAAGCCEIDRRLKRSPRYPAIWREYPSWRVNGAEGKGVDQAWNIGRWKRLPGLVAWAIGSYDPLQVVRPHMQTRDVLWKRTIQSQLGAAAAIALILFGLSFLPEDFSRLFWMPIAGLAFAITYVALLGRIKCPRCDYPFLNCGIYRIKLGSIKYRINHCPHCGTSLDSEWGPNQSVRKPPSTPRTSAPASGS